MLKSITKNKKGMEISFSTIAMLVGVLVVLLVVMVFFRGNVQEVGARFGLIGQSAEKGVDLETAPGGGLDISSLIGRIKGRFSCTRDADCIAIDEDFKCYSATWKCAATVAGKAGDAQTTCYYVPHINKNWGPYYPSETQCKIDCSNACDSPECTEVAANRCMDD